MTTQKLIKCPKCEQQNAPFAHDLAGFERGLLRQQLAVYPHLNDFIHVPKSKGEIDDIKIWSVMFLCLLGFLILVFLSAYTPITQDEKVSYLFAGLGFAFVLFVFFVILYVIFAWENDGTHDSVAKDLKKEKLAKLKAYYNSLHYCEHCHVVYDGAGKFEPLGNGTIKKMLAEFSKKEIKPC